MIELSFDNVNNALSKGISMELWSPNHYMANHLFNRAKELYCNNVKDCHLMMNPLAIDLAGTVMRFRSWTSVVNHSWQGFRGVHMIHPELSTQFEKQRDFNFYDEMKFHNERYLDQWRA